jgi:hypothetical protein
MTIIGQLAMIFAIAASEGCCARAPPGGAAGVADFFGPLVIGAHAGWDPLQAIYLMAAEDPSALS